jgi:RNA polymerase sigma factor (TIGR02999 family)
MPSDDESLGHITVYLKRIAEGDTAAEDPLADLVYVRLQRIARGIVRPNSSEFSLGATSLVNEVLLELIRLRSVDWQDRAHFFRVASRMLRRRFIDYIRERRAKKRPQPGARLEIEGLLLPSEERFDEVLFVHQGLVELSKFDQDLADLVEDVYFGGLPIRTAAEIRGVADKTIQRHLELARKWLENHFRGKCPSLGGITASHNVR